MTLVNTFSMMERHRPAMMSSGVLPLRCSETMDEFMNTVQRLPSTAGFFERKAESAMSWTLIPRFEAKDSKNEPQPDEQASFTTMSVMMPSSSQMAFMSCPPMSKMKVASGTQLVAAWACTTVSTVWWSAWSAWLNSSSPYPVVPTPAISSSVPAATYLTCMSSSACFKIARGSPSLEA